MSPSFRNHDNLPLQWHIQLIFYGSSKGANDVMILEATKESFHSRSSETDFNLEHMWHDLHHHPKWCTRHMVTTTLASDGRKRFHHNLNNNYSSTSLDSVEPTRPIGHGRARAQCKETGSATSHLSWRRSYWTSSTRSARGWLNQNCLSNSPTWTMIWKGCTSWQKNDEGNIE